MTYIGIDAHLKTSTFAYLIPATGELGTFRCYTCKDDILRKLANLPRPWKVATEACLASPALCKWLIEAQAEVRLVDAQTLHQIARLDKAKTDAKDAELLRDLFVQGRLPECYLATPEVEARRELSRHQVELKQRATACVNQLRALFARSGLEIALGRFDSKATREAMPGLIARLPEAMQWVARDNWELLQTLWRQSREVEQEIARQVKASPIASQFAKMPGIGPIIAFALWAEIGEIERFASAGQLNSYAGIVPKVYQSGSFHATGHLSDRCNKHLRYVIVSAAQCAARAKMPNKAKATYQRVKRRRGANSGKIAGARTLLTQIFWLWQHSVLPVAV